MLEKNKKKFLTTSRTYEIIKMFDRRTKNVSQYPPYVGEGKI